MNACFLCLFTRCNPLNITGIYIRYISTKLVSPNHCKALPVHIFLLKETKLQPSVVTVGLLALCLIINTLSAQTYVSFDTNGDMIIHNVITDKPDKIIDLKIPMGKGKDFTYEKGGKDQPMGNYMKVAGGTLKFTKRQTGYSTHTFEIDLQKKKIKYDEVEIKPTFSYMISAHGVEYREQAHRDANHRVNWNTMSSGPSTLYFFAPSYTKSDIGISTFLRRVNNDNIHIFDDV